MRTRIRMLWVVLMLLMVFVSGCDFLDQILGKKYSVVFVVSDATQVLSDATVSFGTDTTTTDLMGKATFPEVKPGTYDLTITQAGYQEYQGTYVIEDDLHQVIYIEPLQYSVSFQITDAITETRLTNSTVILGDQQTITDDQGMAVFTERRMGEYQYQVSCEGYEEQTGSLTVEDRDLTQTVKLQSIAKEYSLTFEVLTEGSDPIAEAQVALEHYGSSTTDLTGKVTVTDLVPGEYSFTVSKEGFYDFGGTVQIDQEELNTVQITLFPVPPPPPPTYTIGFQVYEVGTTNLVEGAIVDFAGQQQTTDNLGQVTFGSIEAGLYTFTIQKADYQLYEKEIEIIADHTEIVHLQPISTPITSTVTFEVVAEQNTPISGAEVTLGDQEPQLTDSNGIVSFTEVSLGTYHYLIQRAGYQDVTGSLNVESEVVAQSVTLTPPVSNQAPSLEPIGDQSVNENQTLTFTIHATDPEGDQLAYQATGELATMFDPATQIFSWTPGYETAGTYSITFTASDGELSDSEQVTITVNRVEYQVSGTVTDSLGNGLAGVRMDFSGGYSSVYTDQTGYWAQSALSGSVDVTPHHDDYLFQATTMRVEGAGSDVNFVGTLQYYPVTFVVSNSTEQISGAKVTVGTVTKVTDESGVAVFNLPNGTYTYSSTALAHQSLANQSFSVSSAPLQLDVELTYQASTWSSNSSFTGAFTQEFSVDLTEISDGNYFELYYIGTTSQVLLGQRKQIDQSLRCFNMYFEAPNQLEIRFYSSMESVDVLGAARLQDTGGLGWLYMTNLRLGGIGLIRDLKPSKK